jgi:uncharacterized membrane protein YkoI
MDARRFDELLQRWQDGDAASAELEELASLLKQDPLRRRELVTSIRLELNLHRKYAPAKAAAPARRRRWELVAAALVLALSAFLVGRLLLMRQEPAQRQVTLPPQPVPIGLIRAIELATASGAGVPVKAEVEREDGSSVYSIKLAVGNRTREVELDLTPGRILEDEVEGGDRSAVAAALKVPLAAAIGKALEAVPGRPVQAEAEIQGGKIVVEVGIIAGSAVRKIVIDGDSGQVIRR